MNSQARRGVRASLRTQVIIEGTDRSGKSFQIEGESLDFSRRGLGLLLSKDLVAPGAVVSVSVPNKFRTNAVVQWTRKDEWTGEVRLGVKMLETTANVAVRIAASFLLCLALLAQAGFARSRGAAGRPSGATCISSLSQMRNFLEDKLGEWTVATDSEKAFVHAQHLQISCSQYTKTYEKSNFYADKNKRAAVARWHWNQYHSKDAAVRTAAIENAQTPVGAGN